MAEAPKKGRLTLYEDLLSDETRAERKAKDAQAQADEAKKKKDASLMFKPTNLGKKSTNAAKPANKPKPTFASMHKLSSSTSTTISAPPTVTASSPDTRQLTSDPPQPSQPQPQPQPQKRGFSDWLANEDEEWMYDSRPANPGRNKKKKKNKQSQEEWSWEDIYDPRVPVNFLEYPKSEVQFDINEGWKQRLYDAHKREKKRSDKEANRGEQQPLANNMRSASRGVMYFAPPPDLDSPQPQRSSTTPDHSDDARASATPNISLASRAPAPAPASASASPAISNAATAEKAAKIAAQIAAMKAKALAAKGGSAAAPPVIQSADLPLTVDAHVPPPPPPPEVPPPESARPGVIAAAPTFNPEYLAWKARQEAGEDSSEPVQPADDPDAPRSNRPGQAGFAERMLKKMGWEKGKGLGASGEGITTAIIAKAEKRKKRPDAQGGGFVAPANMGKIVGGKKAKPAAASEGEINDDLGPMSEVIKLDDMLANMDVDQEIQDNNILQEIGDEMGEFGKVERLFIWRNVVGGHNEVFVKFTSQLSALRAVRDMDGIEFAGNVVKARFWDAEKFERGEYE